MASPSGVSFAEGSFKFRLWGLLRPRGAEAALAGPLPHHGPRPMLSARALGRVNLPNRDSEPLTAANRPRSRRVMTRNLT